MNIAKMHWEFKARSNRLVTSHYQGLLPIHIDSKINEAQLFFLEHFAEVHKLPFETTQARIDMISTLVVASDPVVPTSISGNVYEFSLNALEYDYAHLARAYGACGDDPAEVSIVKHDELSRVLRDQFRRPSRKWGRLVGVFRKNSVVDGSSSLYVYSETGWTLSSITPEYVKQPAEVFFGSYDTVEYLDCVGRGLTGCSSNFRTSTSDPVDSELPQLYHSLLTDIAVMLYYGVTDNPNLYQYVQNKVISTS